MDVRKENICRLCLKVVENDFEVINEITTEIFEVLLLKMNLNISKDPIICKNCSEVAIKCFNFKSVCIDTEDLIFSFAIDKNKAMFEWKDMYEDGKDIQTTDINFICRFCLNHLSGSNFVFLNILLNDFAFAEMLQVLMSPLDFKMIKNPIICTTCRQTLECYFNFVENCLIVEEKITKYFQNEVIPSSAEVKLREILPSSFNTILALDNTQIPAIKQEQDIDKVYCEDDEFIKAEELDIKDEEVNFNETTLDMAIYKLNTPCELKPKITKYWKASTQNSGNPIHHCYSTYDTVNLSCSETGMGKAYQAKYKNVDKKTNQMLSTKNILEANIFKCTMCTYQTKYKGNLKIHMLIHKDAAEVEMYKCSTCTYQAKQNKTLRRYMLIHKDITVVETYKCSLCTYQAKRRDTFKNHMLIHKDITEVEMYKCSMCTYQTKRKWPLKRHMLIHKDITEVEMYECSTCTYQTKLKVNLITHMLIHKDKTEVKMNKCSICTFQTKRKKALKRHMLIHKDIMEVEIYKCSDCTYQSKHKIDLKRHMLIHKDITEVEMYKCSMCTFQTKRKGNLKRHIKIIHKTI